MRVANSRPVLSDEEVALAMRAKGEPDAAVAAALAERAKARQAAQRAYDKGVRSRNDEHVVSEAARLQEDLRREAEAASKERGKGDGTPRETRDDRMAAMGERTHGGKAWRDMPVLHLLNAARKHGDDEMAAYADWKRTHREG